MSAAPIPARDFDDPLRERLCALLGDEAVISDAAERNYFACDIVGPAGASPALIVKPSTIDELQRVLALAAEHRRAIVPRGGGHSYTGGYQCPDPRAILLDLRSLDRIETIATGDGYVICEAGCTWAALYDALAKMGWRTPFFGPLSGIAATIGGALSQTAAFFGSASHGASSDSVLGLEIGLADGTLLRTGAWAADLGAPFQRAYGPDLTSLFLGDCGALGVKTRIALRITPTPRSAFASFALESAEHLVDAQSALAGLAGLAECFGFDPVTNGNLARSGFTLREKADAARDVASATGGWRGVAAAIGLGVNRTTFLRDARYTLHLAGEGDDDAAAERVIEAARAILARFGARELPDSIPRATRAKPFRPIKALLGPDGERWLPVHGICPLSKARAALSAMNKVMDARRNDLNRFNIQVSWLTSLVQRSFLIEPQFFWRDELTPFHLRHVTPTQSEKYAAEKPNPEARAIVFAMREEMAHAFDALGAAHFQIGRYYDYADRLSGSARASLEAIKRAFDPHGIMNPGALGLAVRTSS